MRKSPKYAGGHDKLSAEKKLDYIAASLEASPTVGGQVAQRGKSSDEDYMQGGKDTKNVPPLPSELRKHKTDWQKIINLIVSATVLLSFIGGIIFWFAKMDSKVDTTASDMAIIKPKVEQLVINSEKQDVRLDHLEKAPSTHKKANLRK